MTPIPKSYEGDNRLGHMTPIPKSYEGDNRVGHMMTDWRSKKIKIESGEPPKGMKVAIG